VGKWYTIHNYHWFSGDLPEDTMIYAGPAAGGWGIDDFNTTFHEYSDWSFLMGTPIMYFAGDTQPIEGVKNVPPGTPMWGSKFKEYLRTSYRRRFGMYSQIATLPVESNFLDLDPSVKDSRHFASPTTGETTTRQPVAGSMTSSTRSPGRWARCRSGKPHLIRLTTSPPMSMAVM
jgi:hypothetical protein